MSLQLGDVPAEADVVVIGSGFGGSVVADRLAKDGRGVVVLERGKAYPPGSFARTPAEFGGNFWSPDDGLHGLFDVWSFHGIDAIVSSGLGGGSLIYANVMIRKPKEWFTQAHPTAPEYQESWSFQYSDLEDRYAEVETFLKVQKLPPALTVPKTTAFIDGNLGKAEYAPLAVRFIDDYGNPVVGATLQDDPDYPNIFGLPRRTCCMVGECDVGCNVGAKSSMDHTYLSSASHAGASIHVRTQVKTIVKNPDHFLVGYVVHEPGVEGDEAKGLPRPTVRYIRAQRVVLAAGSLGSTYLLLRNQQYLQLNSAALGSRFCGNGDLLGFLLNADRRLDSTNGPVITAFAEYLSNPGPEGADYGMYIEDAGYPMFLNWLLQAPGVMGRFVWHGLKHKLTLGPDTSLSDDIGRILGSARFTNNALPLLGMGRDVPDGRFFLDPDDPSIMDSTWTVRTSKAYFEEMRWRMRMISEQLGGTFSVNPLYHLGRVISVHPLGGCPADTIIGDEVVEGVVDPYGQVHGVDRLWVCDGATFPGPVGPNPSLTIAAFAHRVADDVIASFQGVVTS
jgi:cholesterol oxidase